MLDSVEDVVQRMHRIEKALPATDGVACFNRVYLQVTETVRARLGDSAFDDARWVARLTVRFADLYLTPLRHWPAQPNLIPRCWRQLLEVRAAPSVLPIQFALAGMNAHINHDLPLAVVTTCQEQPTALSEVKDDYDRINEVLASVSQEIRHSFLNQEVVDAGRHATPLVTLVSNWKIEKARDAAWINAQAIAELERLPALQRAFVHTLDGLAQLASQALLLPLRP